MRQFGIRTVLVVLTFFSIGLLIAEILAGFNFGADTGYLSIPILAYMVAVTIYGLFSLKIGVYYALEYRNSQSSSLLYSAKMLTAIAPALLFNFLMVCHINSTQFTEFMHSALNVKLVIIAPFAIALTMIVN